MRTKNVCIMLAAAVVLLIPGMSRGADVIDQEVSLRVKKIYLEPEQTLWDKGDFKSLAAFTVGYDNNAFLDSRRIADAYTQQYFKTTFSSPLSKQTLWLLDYEFMSLFYAGESKLDLVSNGVRTGWEHKLDKDMSISGGYGFNLVEYINTGTDDYFEQAIDLKFKQNLPQKIFHSIGYDGSYRNYSRRFNGGPAGVSGGKKRDDVRNTFNYEIGKFLSKDMFKLNFEYYNNNSDEKFMNYYDYNSFKFGASLTHLFTEKLFGYMSLAKQFRDYRSRTLSSDASSKQEDRTYLISMAMFYSVNKQLSFGLNYSYRQNKSNEPIERYSGSLVSLSTYYRF